MPLFEFEGTSPKVHPEAFIAPTPVLIGDVTVEAGASVWFNTVVRADYAPVVIREGANVQDGSVLHAPPGIPTDIGPGATVAHMCCVHGAHVGAEALIGQGRAPQAHVEDVEVPEESGDLATRWQRRRTVSKRQTSLCCRSEE